MTVDKNPEKIQLMFNSIAANYDKNNNVISLGLHKYIKNRAINLLNLKEGQTILDICCGTGDLEEIFISKNLDLKISGVDFSEEMLAIAKNKFSDNADFTLADATDLHFPSESFDIVTMSFGLRNIENRKKAIQNAYGILKSGGEFLHLDFGEKNFISKIFDIITLSGIKIFYNKNTPYRYLINSKNEYPTPKELIKEFEDEGFKLTKQKTFLFGILSCQIFTK